MQKRHLTTAALGLTLLLGACAGGNSGSDTAKATTSGVPATSTTTGAAVSQPGAPVTVRTDDLEAELSGVDRDLGGAQQSVNEATDTSPDRADD